MFEDREGQEARHEFAQELARLDRKMNFIAGGVIAGGVVYISRLVLPDILKSWEINAQTGHLISVAVIVIAYLGFVSIYRRVADGKKSPSSNSEG
jgi:hypothetical protein